MRIRHWKVLALIVTLTASLGLAYYRRGQHSAIAPRPAKESWDTTSAQPTSKGGLVRCSGIVKRESNGEALADVVLEFRIGGRLVLGTAADSQGQYEVALAPDDYEIRGRLHPKGIDRLIRKSFVISYDKGGVLDISLPVGPAIAGAVETWDGKILDEIGLVVDTKGRLPVAEKRQCRLNSKGEFRVILERAEGVSSLFALAKGYPHSAPVQLDFVRERDIDGLRLKLEIGGGLEGLVLNESNSPVPSARVMIEPAVKPATLIETRTDEQGRFTFSAVRPGEYNARVEAEGYVKLTLEHKILIGPGELQRDLVLRVREGWRVSGKVIDSKGNPVGRCPVLARESGLLYSKLTNKEGIFLITGIEPGKDGGKEEGRRNKYMGIDFVSCTPKDSAPATFHDVPPGDHLTFVVSAGGSIMVKIGLSDGEVPKFFPWTVSLRLVDSPGTQARPDDSIHLRDGEGSVSTFNNLAPGFYDVQVNANGRSPMNFKRVAVVSGETTPLQVTLSPGEPESTSFSFIMKADTDPEQFRLHLTAFLKGVDKELQDQYIQEFLEDTEDFPALRRIVEEIRKKR